MNCCATRCFADRSASVSRTSIRDQGSASRRDQPDLADLGVTLFLDHDRTQQYLKTVRSDVIVHSVLDRRPLFRYEYRADMRVTPIAHTGRCMQSVEPSRTFCHVRMNTTRDRYLDLTISPAFISRSVASGFGLASKTCCNS